MITNVAIGLTKETHVELEMDIVSQYSEESPPVIRLTLRNLTGEEWNIFSGEPAPLGDNRSKEGPEYLEFQPTEETECEHGMARYPEPIAKSKIGDGDDDCWVVVDGYGPGRGMGAITTVEPQETLKFDYGIVTLRSADRCLPPGEYLFEDTFWYYDHETGRKDEEVGWKMNIEIGE